MQKTNVNNDFILRRKIFLRVQLGFIYIANIFLFADEIFLASFEDDTAFFFVLEDGTVVPSAGQQVVFGITVDSRLN